MFNKFPRPIRRYLYKLNRFLEQLRYRSNRYNGRMQLRARPTTGHWPTARPSLDNAVANRGRRPKKRYTVDEIKAFLRGTAQIDIERSRTIASQFQIGRLSQILDRPIPRRFNGREWLYQRLSLVIVRYAQGTSPAEIADSLSFFYKTDDIEEAVDYVAHLIADSLNRSNSFWG